MLNWYWIAIGTAIAMLLAQQGAIYRIRRASKRREELFQIVTENAADMIALVDLKGNRLYNSPAYKRILGYSAAELGETSAFEQIHPDDRFKVLEAGREARSTGIGKKLEYRIRHKDGTWRTLESVAGTIRDEKGEVSKLVIVNRDITGRKQAEELAEHNSFHDGLTGLPNRRLFLDRLQNLFDRIERNPDRQYAVLFVDLDNFKEFNISAGSVAGDRLIVEMGRRIDACLRDEDTVSRAQQDTRNAVLSRMGGDEFTILLEGVSDPSDAMRVGQRILSAVAEPCLVGEQDVRASASIGIALSAPTHKRAEDVLQDADTAMRRAKALGGSRCEVFDEAMHTRAVNRLTLESQLRDAIDRREFRVHYQPIVQLQTKQIVGFEALLRWQHPEQGLISPDKFMAAADDRGLLVFIGQWVLLQACQQLRSWNTVLPWTGQLSMSVNLSSSQLADPSFITGLEATLARTGIDASRLQLEVSESLVASDSQLKTSVLASLRRLGLGLTLENFGAGETSLFALRQFPGEALKIDRSLIGAMLLDRSAGDLVELIMLAAQKLKLKVTAEGIESTRQLERSQKLGCVLGQGFLFSQPVDAKTAEQLLRQGNLVLQAKQAAL